MGHESDGDTQCKWYVLNNPQQLGEGTGRFRNQWMSRDHPNYSMIMIGKNTEKSPGYLRRLAIPHIPVKNHQLVRV